MPESYTPESGFVAPTAPADDNPATVTPATTLPIIERIRRDIFHTLQQITTANNWHQTLTVESYKQRGESSPSNGLTILYQGEAEPTDSADLHQHEWIVPFAIKFYILQSELVTTAIDLAVNFARSDIEAALCQRSTMQRSNLALRTTPAGFLPFEAEDGEFAGGVVMVNVQFGTIFGEPCRSSYGTV